MKNVLCYHMETNILFKKQLYTILCKLANIHSKIAAFVFKICASGADPGGGAPGAPPPPQKKIGKNKIFWRKIVIFHTKYPNNFRASLRSVQIFFSAPPLIRNPGSAPVHVPIKGWSIVC